jgi:beta-lactamase regulating signal transducer with metallopeptidase domain
MLITPIMETIVKSSVILGFTLFVTMVLRRRSAAIRHTVWTVGLLCSLGLPLFNLVLPAWHVAPIHAVQPSRSVIISRPVAGESGETVVSSPAVVPSTPSTLSPGRMLLLIWLIGVLSVASLLLREAVRLARVAFGATTVQQTSWRELVREVSHALALTRRVRLMRNPNASVLGTWGTLRPRVLLPRESEFWSDERLRVVLGHELAHVKRNDWLIQIIAETARAIYWFNPLFWIACRELRRESEHACDDAAMNLGGALGMDGPTYAGHVLDLARTLKHSGQPASAALAMASPSNL